MKRRERNENLYPAEVQRLHEAIARLPGIYDVASGVQSLDRLTARDLSSFTLGHLPHAALRRTRGGLRREVLVQVDFKVRRTRAGWKSLEFLGSFAIRGAAASARSCVRTRCLPVHEAGCNLDTPCTFISTCSSS